MPDFRPFRGLRYDLGVLGAEIGAVTAPPYDVIDESERIELEAFHESNSVRLILPRDDAGQGDRYRVAAKMLAQLQTNGVLLQDDSSRFYGYRMDFTDPDGGPAHTTGVLGALQLPERAGVGGVLPHERTLPKAKSDRLALLRATRANLDPIWGLSPTPGLTMLIDTTVELASCLDADGTRHTLYAIDDDDSISAISSAITRHPLVLADGHHRFETAIAYREEQSQLGESIVGPDAILCFVVELSDDELCIQPIHRLVTVRDEIDVVSLLAGAFTIEAVGPNTPDDLAELRAKMHEAGCLGLATEDRLYALKPLPEVCEPALIKAEHAAVRGTDAALVEAVIVPLLGSAEWRYRHDIDVVASLARSGEATIGLLLNPVSVKDTAAAAEAGVRMPQKSTYFFPKPRTGMVFRLFD